MYKLRCQGWIFKMVDKRKLFTGRHVCFCNYFWDLIITEREKKGEIVSVNTFYWVV